ncbi:MAG: hypothetical protein HY400_05840 [Elusimicrobia bacterium]|nr:hypothetical protein [Elusimicrobiota bacterium]
MKKILLGITGSIAAYKTCDLVRRLKEHSFIVRCVLTPSAQNFVAPQALAVLSGEPTYPFPLDSHAWEIHHLHLASWADLILIAPATADFVARLAHGRAEGLLDALILASRVPVILCPAMEEQMWLHPATQENVEGLKKWGYEMAGPQEGPLASGKIGMGRLLEVEAIVNHVEKKLLKSTTRKNTRQLVG